MEEPERMEEAEALASLTAEAETARDLFFGFVPAPAAEPLADDAGRARRASTGKGDTG
jgi:hypothetical protein